MKFLKKVMCAVVAISFLFTMSGCDILSPKTTQQQFDEYIETLPTEFLSPDDFNLNYIFKNPQNFGFEEEIYTLPFSTLEDYAESKTASQKIVKRLDMFNRKELDEKSLLFRDILSDYLVRRDEQAKHYYFDNNYLGSFLGFQAQLPLLLVEYEINRKNDLDSYFSIIENLEETFVQYASMERERQTQGVGMSQPIIDKIIEQCKNMAKEEEPFLIEEINKKIDAVDFLNDAEKSEAKKNNENLLKNNYISAYRRLETELSSIDASEKALGLSSLPNGKEYYDYLLKTSVGINMTANELREYIQDQMEKVILRWEKELGMDDFDQLNERLVTDGVDYGEFGSAEETIEYFIEQIKGDFPEISNKTFTVKKIPEAMSENFSPAAYLQGRYDATPDDSAAIYINGEFSSSIFTTIAHEAYPGHMYQDMYCRENNMPAIFNIIGHNGYSEGWAEYIGNSTAKYVKTDKRLAAAAEFNAMYSNCIVALYDIAIHYDGMDIDAFYESAAGSFNMTREQSDNLYYLILETPTNYLTYYVGSMQFRDLYDMAKDALGDSFSPVDFHAVLLNAPSASFSILNEQVDNYIAKNLTEKTNSSNNFTNAA